MKNSEIYKRTLRFSWMNVLVKLIGVVIMLALPTIAFALTASQGEMVAVAATSIAFIVGLVLFALIARYIGYLYTAGQIAMMTEGIATGELPADVYAAGKQRVKQKFVTASVYFALMSIIGAISAQITNAINAVAGSNNPVGNALSMVISVVLTYVNYCSLGWVFLHDEQSSFKSTCDGAVIYFQNWKTLLKNAAKIIGFTLISLVVIGGIFSVMAFFVLGAIPPVVQALSVVDEILEVDANVSFYVSCVIVGVILWYIPQSALVQPYILVSVLRSYIETGMANPPKVDVYGKLTNISRSFRKALEKAEREEGMAAA